MTRLYVGHLMEGLSELASESDQQRLWLAARGPRVGSFDEAVARTYDDSGLSEFLGSPSPEAPLELEAIIVLRQLADALRLVDRDASVEELVTSREMDKVRFLADAALQAIERTTVRGKTELP